jgi:hypothetical protein
MKDLLALTAGLLAIASAVPYFIDVIRKRTKPNIVSWMTWTLLTGIATAAALAAHEPRTALLTGGTTVATLAIVIAGLRYGIAKFSLFDGLCQSGAILGLLLWLVFDSPTIAIVIPVVIDFAALLPTLKHSWEHPGEETWQAFFIGGIAAALTVLSLSHYELDALLFPLYLFVADFLLAGIIMYRRKQSGISLSRASRNVIV